MQSDDLLSLIKVIDGFGLFHVLKPQSHSGAIIGHPGMVLASRASGCLFGHPNP